MHMSRRLLTWMALLAGLAAGLIGCKPTTPFYLRDDKDLSHYRGVATQIEYPDVESDRIADVAKADPPLTVINAEAREIWDLTLQDAIQTAVANSKVVRTVSGSFGNLSTTLANSSTQDPTQLVTSSSATTPGRSTIYAPSIVESDPRAGVEAALAAFDANLLATSFFYKTDQPQNLQGQFTAFQAVVLQQNQWQNETQISKKIASGGQVFIRNFTNFLQTNNPNVQFANSWTPYYEAEFTHPLLQGAGVQFNRIAGPNSFAGLNGNSASPNVVPGNYNGVVIARINQDISLANLEAQMRNMVWEVERTYWTLYYQYRFLDAQMVGRDSALQTWRKIHALYLESARGGEAEKEAQARAQYFLFRAAVEAALSDLYTAENRLRYMMGISTADGRLIRPADEPTTAHVQFDWYESNTDALARYPELRQQRWIIKQHELQLAAAKNFLLPRLDVDALYRFRGFGQSLIGNGNTNTLPASVAGFQNGYQTLLSGQFQEWQAGFNFSMPIGFRQAMAAVRNEQLQLAQQRAYLQDQELEITHQLANAIRLVDRFYTLSQTNFNRRVATQKQVDAVRAAYETQTVTLDLLLEAQRQLADAESTYYDSLSLYNLAIAEVHLRKNSILEYNGVIMAEGPWSDKAYFDARKRARERDAGLFINYGFARPNVYSRGPVNQKMGANRGAIYRTDDQSPASPGSEPVPTPVPDPNTSAPPASNTQTSAEQLRPVDSTAQQVMLAPPPTDNGPRYPWGNLGFDRLPPTSDDVPNQSNVRLTSGQMDEAVQNNPPGGTNQPAASGAGAER
jgi:outer membrane protein TolC